MSTVIMYSKNYCPFCHKAKALLDSLGAKYQIIDLIEHPEKRDEMIKKAHGSTTVPQIFIDGTHIGGCDDLHALHAKGGLKPLL